MHLGGPRANVVGGSEEAQAYDRESMAALLLRVMKSSCHSRHALQSSEVMYTPWQNFSTEGSDASCI